MTLALTATRNRYKANWFDKRSAQNLSIKRHLINIINRHKEADFPWTDSQLVVLNYEDLFEIAVAAVNKSLSIILGKGQDWTNGVDGKVSIVRKNSVDKYTAGIVGCSNKDYIFACVYEGIQDKFYYFAFPVQLNAKGEKMGEHSIPFDLLTGNPIRKNYMWDFECTTFEEMALKNVDPV